MKQIQIDETLKSPFVNFNYNDGIIELKGRSFMANAKEFYKPLVDEWLTEYLKQPKETTTLNMAMDFFNTSSSMWIMHIFSKLITLSNNNYKVIINWYFQDLELFRISC